MKFPPSIWNDLNVSEFECCDIYHPRPSHLESSIYILSNIIPSKCVLALSIVGNCTLLTSDGKVAKLSTVIAREHIFYANQKL